MLQMSRSGNVPVIFPILLDDSMHSFLPDSVVFSPKVPPPTCKQLEEKYPQLCDKRTILGIICWIRAKRVSLSIAILWN